MSGLLRPIGPYSLLAILLSSVSLSFHLFFVDVRRLGRAPVLTPSYAGRPYLYRISRRFWTGHIPSVRITLFFLASFPLISVRDRVPCAFGITSPSIALVAYRELRVFCTPIIIACLFPKGTSTSPTILLPLRCCFLTFLLARLELSNELEMLLRFWLAGVTPTLHRILFAPSYRGGVDFATDCSSWTVELGPLISRPGYPKLFSVKILEGDPALLTCTESGGFLFVLRSGLTSSFRTFFYLFR